MNKNIVNFPGNNEIQKMHKDIKFLDKQDEIDFKESLKIFERALRIGNPQKREKTLKEVVAKSTYNVEAKLALIMEDKKLSLREKRIELDKLELETLDYPIVKDEKELAINNPFYVMVIEFKIYFYLENKLHISYNPYRRSLVELEDGAITKLSISEVDSVKIQLLKDDYYEFFMLYNKLSDELKENEYILLSKIIFEVKNRDFYEAEMSMRKLKYSNPEMETVLDFVAGKTTPQDFDENNSEMLMASFAFTQLAEIIESSEYVQIILMNLNEEIRVDDPSLERSIKVHNITFEDMKEDPTFKGVANAALNRLYEEGLVDAESFTYYTKKDFDYIDGVGKITIKRLEENGVKFKEE